MKYLPDKHKSNRKDVSSIGGQALLLVLLGMAVVLTLVLSVVSRSVTDVSLTTRDEESLRAFSAAEAGIERMIVADFGVDDGTLETGSFKGSVAPYGKGSAVSLPEMHSGESVTVWFVEHDKDGNFVCNDDECFTGGDVDVCWVNEFGDTDIISTKTPAIEVSIFYDASAPQAVDDGDYSNVQVARVAYDVQNRGNSFEVINDRGCEIGDNTYEFFADDILDSTLIGCLGHRGCLLFAKIKMFYNIYPYAPTHGVGVAVDDGILPSQGRWIESTGTSGDATAKIEVFQSYREPLNIFESALFSTESLVKIE